MLEKHVEFKFNDKNYIIRYYIPEFKLKDILLTLLIIFGGILTITCTFALIVILSVILFHVFVFSTFFGILLLSMVMTVIIGLTYVILEDFDII